MSALYLGHLHAGERVPSIRQVAAETGEDPRAVARAYRILEREGLVEVRQRSGIVAVPQAHVEGGLLDEAAQWAARVLVDGWKRGIAFPLLPSFFSRCAQDPPLRCALVESSQDAITAFTHELHEDLGLEVRSVRVGTLPFDGQDVRAELAPRALRDADLVVTTLFHAREVGPVAAALGKPMIVATVNADLVAAVERRLRSGGLTVVCVDPGFGVRLRTQYHALITSETRLRVVTADDRRAVSALDRSQPVLLTRAAAQLLGKVGLKLVFPHTPTLSASSALEIAEFVVRFNLARAPQRSAATPRAGST